MNSKWYFVLVLFLGAQVAGQAIYYFVGGDTYQSTSLRDLLVFLQLIFGLAVVFYGWRKFRSLNNVTL